MSERRRARFVLASASALALAFGGILVGASSAQAFCPEPGSSLCSPAALPILVEAGIASAPEAAGAAAVASGTGGLAALSAEATSVAGTRLIIAAGGATVAGVLTATGIPSGTTIKTNGGSSPSTDGPCPTGVITDNNAAAPTVPGANCIATTFTTHYAEISGGTYVQGAVLELNGTLDSVEDAGTYVSFHSTIDFNPSGSGTVHTYLPNCLYLDPLGSHASVWTTTSTASNYSLVQCASTRTFDGVTMNLAGYGYRTAWDSSVNRQYTMLWTPNYAPSDPGWHGTVRSTVTCHGPSGDHDVTATAPVSVDAGGTLPVPAVSCPAGEIASSATVDFMPTTGGEWLPLLSGTTPGSVKSLVETYPNCFGPSVATPCSLQLYRLDGSTPITCGHNAAYCPDWASDPDATTKYQCKYGTYVLDLDYCSAFRAPKSGILPNYNLDTDTPIPITAPVPATLPNPVQDASGDPVTVPNPDPGTNPSDCWPTGWGVFNPLAWVYDPIVCAAKYLFTPNTSEIETDTEQIKEAWDGTPPGLIIAAVAGWTIVPPASGCNGITFDTSWLFMGIGGGSHSMTIMQACPGDMLAPIATWSRVFMDLAFIVGAVLAITRYIAGIVAFGGLGKDE